MLPEGVLEARFPVALSSLSLHPPLEGEEVKTTALPRRAHSLITSLTRGRQKRHPSEN